MCINSTLFQVKLENDPEEKKATDSTLSQRVNLRAKQKKMLSSLNINSLSHSLIRSIFGWSVNAVWKKINEENFLFSLSLFVECQDRCIIFRSTRVRNELVQGNISSLSLFLSPSQLHNHVNVWQWTWHSLFVLSQLSRAFGICSVV